MPSRIYASASKVLPDSAPLASIVTYEFPTRNGQPPVRAVWYDGGLRPALPRFLEQHPLPDEGTLYIGEDGALLHTWSGLRLFPEQLTKTGESIKRSIPRRGGTWAEWAEACRGGEPAGCDFTRAGPLTSLVLLGNTAIRVGKPLDWDAERSEFRNHPDANRYLHDAYHNGWSLEAA